MLKLLFESKAADFAKELDMTIENILENISDEKEVNPFELKMTIAKKGNQIIASTVQSDGTELDAIDAGLLFEDMIKSKIDLIPDFVKNTVLDEMGGVPGIRPKLLEMMTTDSLLIQYNQQTFQLEYHKVTTTAVTPIQPIDLIKEIDLSNLGF